MFVLSQKRRWLLPITALPTSRIREGRRFLTSDGVMLLEHGWKQGDAVRALFREAGYHDVTTCRDYGDNDRLTTGRFSGMEKAGI